MSKDVTTFRPQDPAPVVIDVVPASPISTVRGLAVAGCAAVAIFIGGFGVWAAYAPLESAAMGPGVIEAASNRKTIQHLEGGIVGKILVRDGDEVAAGQTLIRLDDTKARTTRAALQGQLGDALAREARLLAERDGEAAVAWPARLVETAAPGAQQIVAGQQKIFDTRRMLTKSKTDLINQRIAQVNEEVVGLQAQEAAMKKSLAYINEEMVGIKQLLAKGLERKPRALQLSREQAEIDGRRGELAAQIAKAQQTIAESRVQILNLQNDIASEGAKDLRETQQKIHELGEQIEAASAVLARVEVKAPEAGTVTDLKVKTPGGVIQAGEPLMDLVPKQDQLIVTVEVRPEDINVVHPGLPAQVHLIPYKSRRVPPIEGEVTYVSADRLVDKKTGRPYYAAKVKLSEEKLAELAGEVQLVPGMPGEVMIKTGHSTVAMYALSPILDSFHRAARER